MWISRDLWVGLRADWVEEVEFLFRCVGDGLSWSLCDLKVYKISIFYNRDYNIIDLKFKLFIYIIVIDVTIYRWKSLNFSYTFKNC